MNKFRGTSGPWHAVGNSWSDTGVYGEGRTIAALSIENACTEDTQEHWEAKQAADAALIVAAPDMLEALQVTRDVLHECAKQLRCMDCGGHAHMALARVSALDAILAALRAAGAIE